MFGKCIECELDAGYFQLNDRLCGSCIAGSAETKKQGNLSRVFECMPYLLILIFLALIMLTTAATMPSLIPEKLTMLRGADSPVFYLTILMIIIPIIISLIIRFVVVRRRIHIAFALPIIFPFLTFIAVLSKIDSAGGSPSLIGVLSIAAAFRILRLKNREVADVV
jgi:hypothetical protein